MMQELLDLAMLALLFTIVTLIATWWINRHKTED